MPQYIFYELSTCQLKYLVRYVDACREWYAHTHWILCAVWMNTIVWMLCGILDLSRNSFSSVPSSGHLAKLVCFRSELLFPFYIFDFYNRDGMGTKRRTIKNWFEAQHSTLKRKSLTNDFILMTIVLTSCFLFFPFDLSLLFTLRNTCNFDTVEFISKSKSKVIKLFEIIRNKNCLHFFSWGSFFSNIFLFCHNFYF